MFVAAALDSSFLSFAGGVDLWLVSQSALMPSRMPLFALAATAGSVAGCSALYFTIRKGEEAILERHRSQPRFARVRQYVEKYGAWSLFVISILPPPSPFKLCVTTSGLLKLPYRKFVLALAVGRSIRYFGEGFLTVRYGQQAWELQSVGGGRLAAHVRPIVPAFSTLSPQGPGFPGPCAVLQAKGG